MAAWSGTHARGVSSLKAQEETEAAPDRTDFWDRARVTSRLFLSPTCSYFPHHLSDESEL